MGPGARGPDVRAGGRGSGNQTPVIIHIKRHMTAAVKTWILVCFH